MKTFKEWVDSKNEMYGYGDEDTERFHNELVGIRETLKNCLADAHNRPQRWGDIMMKCTDLKQKYPRYAKEFDNIYYYIQDIAGLHKPYVEKLSYGRKYKDMRDEYDGISGVSHRNFDEIKSRIDRMINSEFLR